MKRLLITILFLSAVLPLPAQLYHPGEQLSCEGRLIGTSQIAMR